MAQLVQISPQQRLARLQLPELAHAEVRPLLHSAFWCERDALGQPTWTAQGREYRRWACHNSVLRFALTYFVPYLTDQESGQIGLCEAHLTLCRIFQAWRIEGEHYDAFIGPRRLGKSTWRLIGALWCLAYGYRRSLITFGRTKERAQEHFVRLSNALNGNLPQVSIPLLADFPELTPVKGAGAGKLRLAGNPRIGPGWISYNTIQGSVVGQVNDFTRADMMIGDDLQSGAGKVTPAECAQTKEILAGSILPMGASPAVLLLGTSYEVGDLGHDIVMTHRGERCRSRDQGLWLRRFRCHYERPDWPARWPPAMLTERRTRDLKAYAQEFEPHLLAKANAERATYWHEGTHRETYLLPAVETDPVQIAWRATSVISIDHAVSEGKGADDTAIVVLTRSPDARTACLEYCERGNFDTDQILDRIWRIWEKCPADRKPTLLLWERVQGGTKLASRITPLPGSMRMHRRTEPDGSKTPGYMVHAKKDDRIDALHSDCAAGRLVLLAASKSVQLFKDQAEAWRPGASGPGVDDLLDAVSGGVRYLLAGDPEM